MGEFGNMQEFEEQASKILAPNVWDYFFHGADPETGVADSVKAFKKYRICPRLLRNVSNVDISTTILGEKVSMPLGVSPMAHQKCAHGEGECASARAAEAANVVFILSSFANYTIEQVAEAAPKATKWLQMFIFKDRDIVRYLVRRAENAGYKGLVVTIDGPILPQSRDHKLESLPNTSRYAIFEDYFLAKNPNDKLEDVQQRIKKVIDSSVTWEDVTWLKSITKLPIILKGILTPEDASLGVKYGASAILVSNHGGRLIEGVPATIEALPGIVKAVAGRVEVYLDGGVKQGTDVFKALALGAKMVFFGRPILLGLACGGQEGVQTILETMRREIRELLTLTGCSNMQEVTRNLLMHESCYSRL